MGGGRIFAVSALDNVCVAEAHELVLEERFYAMQVKQKDKAGRPDIDAFETAMRRAKCEKSFFVSFDYSSDALREIDCFFREEHRIIVPLTVQEILDAEPQGNSHERPNRDKKPSYAKQSFGDKCVPKVDFGNEGNQSQMMFPPILADIGLPMVALYLPAAWLALIPIILIEAAYGSLRYRFSFPRAVFAQTAANSLSTLIGIPVTWTVLALLQFFALPGGAGPAWLFPNPRPVIVAAALIFLTVIFYLMSVVTEGLVVARFFRGKPRGIIRRWSIQANALTYVLLLSLISAGFIAPKAFEPMSRLMQPVNEVMVEGVFWVANQVSGKQKKEAPLIQAVRAGDLKKAHNLIASGADVNQTNAVGFSALSIAAGGSDEKMTKLLLDAGANVNDRSATLRDTALARAAQNGNVGTVRVLLAAGAKVDDRDGSGWTPLFNAALMGHLETIDALLAAGADVNARSSNGWTALKEARMRGYEDVAERLRAAGAIDFPDGSR